MSSVVYELSQDTQGFQTTTTAINNRKWTSVGHTCMGQFLLSGQHGMVNLVKVAVLLFKDDSVLDSTNSLCLTIFDL